ncbi:MAG: glycine--tRNA ligase subunit alpha [candidate division WOR-3 bacterium]
MNFQDIILKLHEFWKSQGCVILQPYNSEVGAGTFNPATFLRSLGPKPWRAAYVEPTRRPKDGRYAENPNRLQQYHQYQVILKPPPDDVVEIYIKSLEYIGIDVSEHDLRFVEDDWESPTLGAWGLGWEVWLDGLEITQFTYFQQVGGVDVDIVSAEITYGLERIAMFVQGVDNVFDIKFNDGIKWGDIYREFERQFCHFNFEEADIEEYRKMFDFFEKEAHKLAEKGLLYPAYDMVIKMSHVFNLLDARRAISPEERQNFILRVRRAANKCAKLVVEDKVSL